MFKRWAIRAVAGLLVGATAAAGANAAGEEGHTEDIAFSFEGPFGTFEQNQLQRGLQVYTEVCAACHGLKFVPLRTLADEGGPHLPQDQVRAYAAQTFEVYDLGLEDFRPAAPADHFPESPLETAPDLSLITKARAGFHGPAGTGINQLFRGTGGAEYVYSLLVGYTGKEYEDSGIIYYENTAYPGGLIAMAPPLSDGLVEYADGHSSSVHHMAEDVAAFLAWTAEPKMMARKRAGFIGVLLLAVLATLLYLSNKKLWAPIKRQVLEGKEGRS